MQLNSKGYWDARFSSGYWQSRGGVLKEKAVQRICITVPYEEPLNSEHVRRYSSGHFEIVLSGSAEHVFRQSTGLSMADVIYIYISRIWAEGYVANLYDHARCRLCSDLT